MFERYLTKSFLQREYVDNRKSCGDIAVEVDCSRFTVHYYLKKWNIPRRSRIEAVSKPKPEKKLTAEELESKKRDLLERQLKLAEEVKKLRDSLKYPLTKSQVEHNREIEAEKARKKERERLQREMELENKVSGVWHVGNVDDQFNELQERFGGKI